MNQMIAALDRRVRLAIGRAVVRLVDDARTLQELQIDLLDGESQDAVERFQQYGIASHPHPGAEAVVVCAGGLRSHALVIAVDDRRYRLTGLQEGEVALFDDLGNLVKLGREGIEIVGESEVKVAAPKVVVESDDVHLGAEGGPAVARIGDSVDPATNKIITGSPKVTAA
ncbi:MAG: phage baseplate assembly protein V [Sphingomonadales bacterium CG12_big_fil_rev_8_21_14_0_65_65_10]|nr:MAG: phage baseplate assembly protein V [Sphingomonadales bacterium CG12_big_fil_rev_8_21_14_0_65_65_10]